MARCAVDLGAIRSKYDCLLGREPPRHRAGGPTRVRQARAGLGQRRRLPLPAERGQPGGVRSPARRRAGVSWPTPETVVAPRFTSRAAMLPGPQHHGAAVPSSGHAPRPGQRSAGRGSRVRLTVRVDIEDRSFHWETKRNGGSDHHFSQHTRDHRGAARLRVRARPDRQLPRLDQRRSLPSPSPSGVTASPHPVEASRGLEASGDAYSPGWFELPLPKGAEVLLVVSAEPRTIHRRASWPRRWLLDQQDDVRRAPDAALRPARTVAGGHGSFAACLDPGGRGVRGAPRRRQDRHRRLSVVPRLGSRHPDLRPRVAGGGVARGRPADPPGASAGSSTTARCPTRSTARTPPTATPPMRRSGSAWCARNWRRGRAAVARDREASVLYQSPP